MRPATSVSIRARERLVGLDLLRLLAVLLVLGRHMAPVPGARSNVWGSLLIAWQRGGWVGVDLFFVLSGFLVSGLLFAEYKSSGRLSINRFYTRRGWKIYPPFLTLIVITVTVHSMTGIPIARAAILSELFFLQSYLPGLWDHTWSLAVEEHFYLLLPLTLALVLRLKGDLSGLLNRAFALAASVALCAFLLRTLNAYYRPRYTYLTHHYASHLRLDSLFFGVVISYAYHFYTPIFVSSLARWRLLLIVGGALSLTPAFLFQVETTPIIHTLGFTLFSIGSGMLVAGTVLCKAPRNRILAVLARLGEYTYSIYLWHGAVIEWFVPLVVIGFGLPRTFGVLNSTYLIGSLSVGVVMAKIIEVPALRFRDRFFPPRSAGPIEDASR